MKFLQDTFRYLNENCNYAVLRSFDDLPDHYESHDIDMIMSETEYDRVKADLYGIAEKHGYKLLQYYRDERFVTIFFQKVTENSSDILELDFFFAMSAKGIIMIDAEDILKNRCFNGKVYYVSLVDEVLDKCLCNGVFGVAYPERYMCRYEMLSDAEKAELNQKLEYVFGCDIHSFAIHQRTDGKTLTKYAMKQGVRHRGVKQYLFRMRHLSHIIKNLLAPRGIFMSFTGPDGSGKTTVLDLIGDCYEKVFRGSIQVHHFRPDVLPRLAVLFHRAGLKKTVDEEYDKPHRGKPSGTAGSIVRIFYYILDYQIGYLLKIRNLLFRRNVVIYDRYFFDIIADAARSNIGLDYRVINKLGILVPKPKFAVLLTAKAETITARKKELSEDEIREINRKLEFMEAENNARIIYNETTAEKAACAVMKWILDEQDKKLCKNMVNRNGE